MSEWNAQSRLAAERLESFILETRWEDLPVPVQERAVTCVMDLFGLTIACSRTHMAHNGIRLAEETFAAGSIPVVGTSSRMSLMGAVTAYGYNINALDADDGHNMIKGHPGAVLMAGLWPAAIQRGVSYKEFLTAMAVGYEVAIRAGLALHRYYGYYHGTGSWGAFGVAAGVSRLLGCGREVLSNALGIADYQGPIAPVMRIVEIPSMNKDGIAWGAVTGAMAVEAAAHGITGRFYNLLEQEHGELLLTLGAEYEILNVYFKSFPCCRWAQPAIVAALTLRRKHALAVEDVDKISIRTFKAATQLSSVTPTLCDEAQYNMIYPVCAALAEGRFTPIEVSEDYLRSHPQVVAMMERVSFEVDENFEAQFPRKRYAQLKLLKTNGETLVSDVAEPLGEAEHRVDPEWVFRKLQNFCAHCFPREAISVLLDMLRDPEACFDLCDVVQFINRNLKEGLIYPSGA
jgi:2-methylcitrate dehydratase PrpD